jgi:predicted dienelactone hydrolase
MKKHSIWCSTAILMVLLFACNPATIASPEATETKSIAAPTITPEPTATSVTQETSELAVKPSEPADFPLSEPGPYFGGNQVYTLVDDSRSGREIELLIWYPAIKQTDADGHPVVRDAVPDTSGAPYPVIITEENSGRYIFLSHLATHGFVLVVVQTPPILEPEVYASGFHNALDFLFSLDQISANPPAGLENMLDTNRVGVTGYSYGGDISLMISGARVDPEFYLSQCEHVSNLVPEAIQWIYDDFYCLDARNWDEFLDLMGDEITKSDDGLWQPLTDERIKAVMPMAPTLSWYYGERGFAAVERPTFLLWGTRDEIYPTEAAYTFDHLIIPDRYLVSFIGKTHKMLPMTEYGTLRLKHLATAFFGYYLQGREDYADYFSEEFINQFDDLAWGVYEGE